MATRKVLHATMVPLEGTSGSLTLGLLKDIVKAAGDSIPDDASIHVQPGYYDHSDQSSTPGTVRISWTTEEDF